MLTDNWDGNNVGAAYLNRQEMYEQQEQVSQGLWIRVQMELTNLRANYTAYLNAGNAEKAREYAREAVISGNMVSSLLGLGLTYDLSTNSFGDLVSNESIDNENLHSTGYWWVDKEGRVNMEEVTYTNRTIFIPTLGVNEVFDAVYGFFDNDIARGYRSAFGFAAGIAESAALHYQKQHAFFDQAIKSQQRIGIRNGFKATRTGRAFNKTMESVLKKAGRRVFAPVTAVLGVSDVYTGIKTEDYSKALRGAADIVMIGVGTIFPVAGVVYFGATLIYDVYTTSKE